jgi:hypothetical protein
MGSGALNLRTLKGGWLRAAPKLEVAEIRVRVNWGCPCVVAAAKEAPVGKTPLDHLGERKGMPYDMYSPDMVRFLWDRNCRSSLRIASTSL